MKLTIANTLYRCMCVLLLPFALVEVILKAMLEMFKYLTGDVRFTLKEFYKDFKYGVYRKEIEHKEFVKGFTSNKIIDD